VRASACKGPLELVALSHKVRGWPLGTLRRVFTGIIREVARVADVAGGDGGISVVIEAPLTAPAVEVGDSVSINGVCLTAESVEGERLAFHAVPETLRRSSFRALRPGGRVNVEPALRAGDALGGHYVQGHVDGVGLVRAVEREGDGVRLVVAAPAEILRYCVEKGSIAVEGVSLTVAALDDGAFEVALIPHTLAATTLGELQPGGEVNLEVDVLAKYVERLLPRV
jgi:riboflavin synthase